MEKRAHHLENADLDKRLVVVGRLILDDLDSHILLRILLPALGDLAKRALSKHVLDDVTAAANRQMMVLLKAVICPSRVPN